MSSTTTVREPMLTASGEWTTIESPLAYTGDDWFAAARAAGFHVSEFGDLGSGVVVCHRPEDEAASGPAYHVSWSADDCDVVAFWVENTGALLQVLPSLMATARDAQILAHDLPRHLHDALYPHSRDGSQQLIDDEISQGLRRQARAERTATGGKR